MLRFVEQAIADGVDLIQIREKDMSTRELLDLSRHAVALAYSSATKILVNSRADVALVAGADGVHLPAESISPLIMRRVVPPGFLIGVSCHEVAELRRAELDAADFAFYGPVFATPGKGAPIGLNGLRAGVSAVKLPVYALGGVNKKNAADCLAAGAAGVAAITWFQKSG